MRKEKKISQYRQRLQIQRMKTKKILGVIESCGYLRVRKEPNKEADVIATIPVGTMVELVNDEVIDGFYAVHIEAGDGYCMADYIHITYPEKE